MTAGSGPCGVHLCLPTSTATASRKSRSWILPGVFARRDCPARRWSSCVINQTMARQYWPMATPSGVSSESSPCGTSRPTRRRRWGRTAGSRSSASSRTRATTVFAIRCGGARDVVRMVLAGNLLERRGRHCRRRAAVAGRRPGRVAVGDRVGARSAHPRRRDLAAGSGSRRRVPCPGPPRGSHRPDARAPPRLSVVRQPTADRRPSTVD